MPLSGKLNSTAASGVLTSFIGREAFVVAKYLPKKADEQLGNAGTFTRFASDRETEPGPSMTLRQVIDEIRSDAHKALVDLVRAESDKEKRRGLKSKLPAVSFSGSFSKRCKDALQRHSGLVCLDFDLADNPRIDRNAIQRDPHTLAAFASPSGGLKVIVEVDDTSDHLSAFQSARDHYAEKFLLVADESGKDVSRLCYLSHDPDAYFSDWTTSIKVRPRPKTKAPEIRSTSDEWSVEKVDAMLAAIRADIG